MRRLARSARVTIAVLLGFGGSAALLEAQPSSWQARLSATTLELTAEDELDPDLGLGLAFEYRASDRVGFELGVFSSELESSETFDLGGFFRVDARAAVRITPVLAGLNVHLTPQRRVDLYAGVVAGVVLTGDLDVSVRLTGLFDTGATVSFPVDDSFAWGGHLGVDVPLGAEGLSLGARVSVLNAEVGVSADLPGTDLPDGIPGADPDLVVDSGDIDLAMIAVQAGIGYRF